MEQNNKIEEIYKALERMIDGWELENYQVCGTNVIVARGIVEKIIPTVFKPMPSVHSGKLIADFYKEQNPKERRGK